MPRNIAIVGSGFLGLTLALRFSESGDQVTVFETAPEIGGLASSWQIGDVVWDKHYHVTLLSDTYTRRIVERVGLGDDFEWVETKTGFYSQGKLVSMSNVLEFLRFPLLGLVGKFRLGATIFYASRVTNWKALEKISVSDWLTKLSGKRTFEKIWMPLLKAKLGTAYRETSAAFVWATIQRMYAARKSGMKKEMFGYVRGGYARVLRRFDEVLRERGVTIRLGERVSGIRRRDDGKFEVRSAPVRIFENGNVLTTSAPPESDGERYDGKSEFDTVILTCPSDVACKISPQLTDDERRKLESIRYQGIVCASVLMKKPLSEYYVTNIVDETPFTGVIEMSALVNNQEFGGRSLLYLPKYVPPDDPLFEKSDDELEQIFLDGVEKMYAGFSRADVVGFRISRVRKVFPLPVLNYSSMVPPMKSSIDGLYIVNSTHIVNGTLNVNETVQLAEKFFETYSSAGLN